MSGLFFYLKGLRSWDAIGILLVLSMVSFHTNKVTGMETSSPNCTICKNETSSGCSDCFDGCYLGSYLPSASPSTTETTTIHAPPPIVGTPSSVTRAVLTTTTTPTTTTPGLMYKCYPCSSPCKTCTANDSNCTSCFDGYQLNDNSTCVEQEDSDDELPVAAIAASVIGGIVFLAIVVVLAICLVRKCKRGAEPEPVSFEEGGVAHGSPQTPKIETEEMQRVHDKITRYTQDPTSKKDKPVLEDLGSTQGESRELDQLPLAPPPPIAGLNYEQLQTENPDAPQSYEPLAFQSEGVYGNISAIQASRKGEHPDTNGRESPQEVYCNDQAVTMGSSPEKGQPPTQLQSQVSEDLYEPMTSNKNQEEPQELYMNHGAEEMYLNHASEAHQNEEPQEIYCNEAPFDNDDIYENTQGN